MNDNNAVKRFLIEFIAEKRGGFDGDEWEADYKLDWNEEFSELMIKAAADVSRAAAALRSKDEVELGASVISARISFMDLSGFFRNIFDDFDVIARETPWPEIPDDFVYDKS